MELFIPVFIVIVIALVGLLVQRSYDKKLITRVIKDKEEYQKLFEVSSLENKDQQTKIQAFLEAISQKDIWIERGMQAVENSNKLLKETQTILDLRASEILSLQEALRFQEEQYDKLLGQKKSSEVRTGKITEQLSPFLNDYPLAPETAKFIGDPIDFVHFDEDKITFVEVKSGKSQLSRKQKDIKELVEQGKVAFLIYRVEGK